MFFRHGADAEKRAAVRARGTNEAQLKELRVKARRRLIGALALVLAAVIVVPWLFQEPVTDNTHAPVVVPATPPGLLPAPAAGNASSADGTVTPDATSPSSAPAPDASAAQGAVAPAQTPSTPGGNEVSPNSQATAPSASELAPSAPESKPAAKAPEAKAPEAKPAEPAPKPAAKHTERTDDGSVALALLAGKTPTNKAPSKPAPAQGRYVLQVAAYTTEQDAQSRRDSLKQAGVTDAYVEKGQSGGRTVYRLRVGPFGSHEAAQAAQARLRALGYQNGLISGN